MWFAHPHLYLRKSDIFSPVLSLSADCSGGRSGRNAGRKSSEPITQKKMPLIENSQLSWTGRINRIIVHGENLSTRGTGTEKQILSTFTSHKFYPELRACGLHHSS